MRALIQQMSTENFLWGAPRIHGELLKLGFSVAQSSVAKYMVKRHGPPSQEWRTFLRNHAPDIVAMDLFVVPTIGFKLLYGFVIIRLDRRDIVWISVTTKPTAEWVARQITVTLARRLTPARRASRRLCKLRGERNVGLCVLSEWRSSGRSEVRYGADSWTLFAKALGDVHCRGR